MRVAGLLAMEKHYAVDRNIIKRAMAHTDDFPFWKDGPAFVIETNDVDRWLELHGGWGVGDQSKVTKTQQTDPEFSKIHGVPVVPADPRDTPSLQKLREKTSGRGDKSHVQTQLLQLELDKKRGNLVPRDLVVNTFAPIFATFAKEVELIPNSIGRELGLSDDVILAIRERLDRARENLVRASKQGIMAKDFALKEEDE